MANVLKNLDIYFDELDKVRIVDPEVSQKTNDLKDECKIYVESTYSIDSISHKVKLTILIFTGIDEFQKLAKKFITMIEKLSGEVEKQKMKAIGARNILQTMEKQQDLNQQQLHVIKKKKLLNAPNILLYLQAVLAEKSMELERLKIQLNSLQKTEMEQNEIILQLMHY